MNNKIILLASIIFLMSVISSSAFAAGLGSSYYIENESQASTSSTSWSNAAVLTFTPSEAGNYLIISSAELSGSSESFDLRSRMTIDGAVYGESSWQPDEANKWEPFFSQKIVYLDSTQHTASIQYSAESGQVNSIKKARIIAIKVDDYFYNEVESESTPTEGSYNNIASLSFTPTVYGDYLVLTTAEVKPGAINGNVYARVLVDGSEKGLTQRQSESVGDYFIFGAHIISGFSAAPHTISVQGQAETGNNNARIKRTRIYAIKLSDFQYNSSDSFSTSTSSNWLTKTELSFTPSQTNDYLVLVSSEINHTSAVNGRNPEQKYSIDGVDSGENVQGISSATDKFSFFSIKSATFDNSPHLISHKFRRASGTGTSGIRNTRISAIRLGSAPSHEADQPSVNVTSPENNTADANGKIKAEFNVDDQSNVSNCFLLVDDIIKDTLYIISKNQLQHLQTSDLPDGNYMWQIRCADQYGNVGSSAKRKVSVAREGQVGLIDFNVTVVDPYGEIINTTVEMIDVLSAKTDYVSSDLMSVATVEKGGYDLRYTFDNFSINEIEMYNMNIDSDTSVVLGVDEDVSTLIQDVIQSFVVNPYVNFTDGIINFTSEGNVLYKCADWNFTERSCLGKWEKIMDMVPGQSYNVPFSSTDPAYVIGANDMSINVSTTNYLASIGNNTSLTSWGYIRDFWSNNYSTTEELSDLSIADLVYLVNYTNQFGGTWTPTNINSIGFTKQLPIIKENGSQRVVVEYSWIGGAAENITIDWYFYDEYYVGRIKTTGLTDYNDGLYILTITNDTNTTSGADRDSLAWVLGSKLASHTNSIASAVTTTYDSFDLSTTSNAWTTWYGLTSSSLAIGNIINKMPAGVTDIQSLVNDTETTGTDASSRYWCALSSINNYDQMFTITILHNGSSNYTVRNWYSVYNSPATVTRVSNCSFYEFSNRTFAYNLNKNATDGNSVFNVTGNSSWLQSPEKIYVVLYNVSLNNNLYNSTDNGATWTLVLPNSSIQYNTNGSYYNAIFPINQINLTTTTYIFGNDTILPNIDFVNPTENASLIISRNYIQINVTASDIGSGLKNITTRLYNSTGSLINSTNSTASPLFSNFTNLAAGNYSFNATAFDNNGNSNSTGTRSVTIAYAPSVIIGSPMGETHDYNTSVFISANITDITGINSSIAMVTLPNTTVRTLLLIPEISSDNFDVDTIGTQWFIENDMLGPSQTCTVNINGAVSGKAYTSIEGDGTPETDTLCSMVSENFVCGDFDMNVTFNMTGRNSSDYALNFGLSETQTSSGATRQMFMALSNWSGFGQQYEIFADDGNYSGYVLQRATNDTYGKFRITRSGNAFSFYTWNNTGNSWINESVSEHMFNVTFGLFIYLEAESLPNDWGTMNASWDDFSVQHNNCSVALFNETSASGTYDIRINATNNLGLFNDTQTTYFRISDINLPPTVPWVTTPTNAEIIQGLYNISWSPSIDPDGDKLRYNITLLNTDRTINSTLITNYGNAASVRYEWNTTQFVNGNYSINVTVYENETTEHYVRFENYLANFTIKNNYPPTINFVEQKTPQDPIEGSIKTVSINFTATNGDSPSDLNFSTVNMTIYGNTNPAIKYTNVSCYNWANGTNYANFTCSFPMKYYDDSQIYKINASMKDNTGAEAFNNSVNFTYNQLKAWTMNVTSISFPAANPGDTNINATDDPITMNNTGNQNINMIYVTAYDLLGVSDNTYMIPAANFTVSIIDTSGGSTMTNNTSAVISGALLPYGASSLETLYFWLVEMPEIIAQNYNTAALGAWIITGT